MNILLTGADGGLGRALTASLCGIGHNVVPYIGMVELATEDAVAGTVDHLDVLINCAGQNDIDWLEDFTPRRWDAVMDANAKGIYAMTRAALPQLRRSQGTVLNIVSNAAHVPMTCSAAYNASKAAALMLTKQLARELTPRYGITVFSVSPNKLAGTGMSRQIETQVCTTRGWTPEYAAEYQRKALLAGEETPPKAVADFIAFLLQSKQNHKYLSGCDIPYGA